MTPEAPWYSWTQPCCLGCWHERNGEDRIPPRVVNPESEVCCYCGESEASGIYVRVDPQSVPHPTMVKERA